MITALSVKFQHHFGGGQGPPLAVPLHLCITQQMCSHHHHHNYKHQQHGNVTVVHPESLKFVDFRTLAQL